jgi:ketosteroid isomerase-like protein
VVSGAGGRLSEIERASQAWTTAWLEHDAAAVDGMMAPGYIYITPTGQVLDRATILDVVRSPEYQASGNRSEVSVVPVGPDAAVVVSRWQGRVNYQGRLFEEDHRCTSVFVRDGQRWRVAAEHASAITSARRS